MAQTKVADPAPPATSITAQVYGKVRDDILTGVLEPGQKLKIDELRQAYGSGSSPIREALSLLTSDGLVERVDQRGFRVALVSAEAFDELLTTRCWLEERALSESIERGGKEWEERVVLAEYRLSRQERSISKNAFIANQDWELRHRDFHIALISACGSSILLNFCHQLYDQNVRYRHVAGKVAYPKRNIAKSIGPSCRRPRIAMRPVPSPAWSSITARPAPFSPRALSTLRFES